ncbi:hypothetical protein BJ878DRAFT_514855 [Calycina marina]|uniref:Uncharacterized protein n=1 Tax=Calycina marina TaxID=1763456 RepID=A0A9P7YZK6_9HELO|nr:hypothetical protein BJ878DRAFT_514855 [Calycina marina]
MPPDNEHDTVLLKGEQWSHPSTPTDRPPSTKLPGLAPTTREAPQTLESPEPSSASPPPRPDTTESSTTQTPGTSTSRRHKKDSQTMEERLQSMPERRKLPWRPGVEAGAEVETGGESRRKQIRFGCLLATRGEVAEPPCLSCANGRGKFALCVALEGYFKGACASCQLSGRPNRCSIKQVDDPTESPPSPAAGETPDATTIQQRPSPASVPSNGPPPAKRKRIGNNSGGMSEWENSRPQWEHGLGGHERQHSLGELPHEVRSIPHAQAIHHQQAQIQHTQQQAQIQHGMQHVQRPWAGDQASPPLIQQHSGPPNLPRTSSGGWAAVNQPPPLPDARRLYSVNSNGCDIHNPPPPPHQQPPLHTNGLGPRRPNIETNSRVTDIHPVGILPLNSNTRRRSLEQHGYREDTIYDENMAPGAPYIDMLPKSKQRQVYGLISGLQGGIEHLQRELAALKQTLGIDDED